jgi:hypothetical protein
MKLSLTLVAITSGAALVGASTLAERVQARALGNHQRLSHPPVQVDTALETRSKFIATDVGAEKDIRLSRNWAGALIKTKDSSGDVVSATGRFTVPTPKHTGSSNATEYGSAWAGIDGVSCIPILQGGLDWQVLSSGDVGYLAWYEWYRDNAVYVDTFNVTGGDVLQVDITAPSTTKGTLTLSNLSTGEKFSQDMTAPSGSPLCRQEAEWIMEDVIISGKMAPLANFGDVVFSKVSAKFSTGKVGDLSGAAIYKIPQNRSAAALIVDTVVSSPSEVTVKYL